MSLSCGSPAEPEGRLSPPARPPGHQCCVPIKCFGVPMRVSHSALLTSTASLSVTSGPLTLPGLPGAGRRHNHRRNCSHSGAPGDPDSGSDGPERNQAATGTPPAPLPPASGPAPRVGGHRGGGSENPARIRSAALACGRGQCHPRAAGAGSRPSYGAPPGSGHSTVLVREADLKFCSCPPAEARGLDLQSVCPGRHGFPNPRVGVQGTVESGTRSLGPGPWRPALP